MAERGREPASAEIVACARALFAERGYYDTSLDDVASAARVSRGAIYYHFEGKRDLFKAVYAAEQKRLAAVLVEGYHRASCPRDAYISAARALLEHTLDAGVQRINFIDAPGVLGWEDTRAISSRYSFGLIEDALEHAMAAGVTARRPVGPPAHLLFGAMSEAVRLLARAEDKEATLERTFEEFQALVSAVLDGAAVRGE